jgi:hypothetical protein
MFKDTQYLYNCDPIDFIHRNYLDALYYKRDMAKKLYQELVKEGEENGSTYELRKREFHVYNAWQHNENLIQEALRNSKDREK